MSAHVVSVNVGRAAPLATGRRVVPSAIAKPPVAGPVAVRGVNLDGDEQADKVNHGGPDHDVTVALVIEALLLDRTRAGELEPARSDMLPKLAGWYAERQAA